MANFSAADVKKLRELTGAGMMDCKKALEEAEGDFDKATELRVHAAGHRLIHLFDGRIVEDVAGVALVGTVGCLEQCEVFV